MIKIVTDSTADVPKELLEKYDIQVVPIIFSSARKPSKKASTTASLACFKLFLPGPSDQRTMLQVVRKASKG